MLFQLCTYQLTPGNAGKPRMGIAKVHHYHAVSGTAQEDLIAVDYVIDCSTGNIVDPRKLMSAKINMIQGPLSFIDTRYTGS